MYIYCSAASACFLLSLAMEMPVIAEKPHAIVVPLPAQGHINPMLKISKLLHAHGYMITFLLTEFDRNRLIRSNAPDSLMSSDDFRFETIPDGLPLPSDDDYSGNHRVPSLCDSVRKNMMGPFRELMMRLQRPRVSLVVWDGFMAFAREVAAELGVADVMVWTASACGFMGLLHFPQLVERGLAPLKDESWLTNGFLDTRVDWIPGMKDIRLKDLPTHFRTTDPVDILFNFCKDATQCSFKASAIIFNTFQELEHDVLLALAQILPAPIYAIGPLSILCKHIPDSSAISSVPSGLWKEDTECVRWLEEREPKSVVYVNFGSVTYLSVEQLLEFGWGLANSNQFFLWVLRPDLVRGEKGAILPEEFATATEGRSLVVDWCAQEQVLMHPSIGAFLTHCGWNSTLEGISAGVPMICWYFFADQSTNCYYACRKWGIGVEIDNDVRRENVKGLIEEVMEGEKGSEMRKKAMEWKVRAEKAAGEGGSSQLYLRKLFMDLV